MSLDDTLNRLNQPMQRIQINVCKTPVLVCIITGRARLTNKKYLEQKAEDSPGETLSEKVKNFQSGYICKEAAKLLRQGICVADVRNMLDVREEVSMITDDQAIDMLKNNGSRNKNKEPDIPWYDGDL